MSAVHPMSSFGGGHGSGVLFLADHLGYADGGIHGVTTYLLNVLPGLSEIGLRVGACFLRHEHPAAEALRAHHIPVHFLDSGRLDMLVFRRVTELVRLGHYDVLHCTQFRASVIGRAVARANADVRTILHVHDLRMPPLPVRLLNGILARHVDLGICVSEAARAVATRGYCVTPEQVRVLYPGVDSRVFKPLEPAERASARAELLVAPGDPVLCLVGRFNLIKGHAAMIRMHRDIARRHQRCRLLLIGDGPERLGCERIVDELGLRSSVLFLGQRSDVSRWLAASDVVVVPSASEGLCRVVVEANLCGRPVVAFDCGGVAEALADPVCGDLVPRGDRQGFIDAVDRRLRTDDRPDAIALRRRAAAERFGLRRHAMALRNCYESLACSDELAHGR